MRDYLYPVSKRGHCWRYSLPLFAITIFLVACGGGGGGAKTPATPETDQEETQEAPEVSFSMQQDVKNPVTDLGRCASSVLSCLSSGTELDQCFDHKVAVCDSETPDGDCCAVACKEQILSHMQAHDDPQEAFLTVLVYDGTCMPGVASFEAGGGE